MGKTSTQAKAKYNAKAYDVYRFNVRKDSELNRKIKLFTSDKSNNLSDLIRLNLDKVLPDDSDTKEV